MKSSGIVSNAGRARAPVPARRRREMEVANSSVAEMDEVASSSVQLPEMDHVQEGDRNIVLPEREVPGVTIIAPSSTIQRNQGMVRPFLRTCYGGRYAPSCSRRN